MATVESLAAYEHATIDLQSARFALYVGATYDDPVEGTFSFVPRCRPGPMPEARQAWDAAVQACRGHGLDLAIRVALPACADGVSNLREGGVLACNDPTGMPRNG